MTGQEIGRALERILRKDARRPWGRLIHKVFPVSGLRRLSLRQEKFGKGGRAQLRNLS